MNEQLKQRFEEIIRKRLWLIPMDEILEVFQEVYNLGRSEQSKWVSVDERLPENDEWKIVCLDGVPSIIPCCHNGNGEWYEYGGYASFRPRITHWKEFNDLPPDMSKNTTK